MTALPAFEEVERTRARVAGRLRKTPLIESASLGLLLGARTYLKVESLQITGSFKARGALNRLLQLSDIERTHGVVAFSAGNHALAIAWAAREVGTPAFLAMPHTADPSKVAQARRYGATVHLAADYVTTATDLCREHQATLIHPFDEAQVMAGQGTLAAEVLDELPELATFVAGIGGGGLIAGCALALRARGSKARIIGVEPEGADTMIRSLASGRPERIASTHTVADGLAPPFAGTLTFPIVRDLVDQVVGVTDAAIIDGMRYLLEHEKLLAEPAGAAAAGALLTGAITSLRAPIVVVVSGGNIGMERLKALL